MVYSLLFAPSIYNSDLYQFIILFINNNYLNILVCRSHFYNLHDTYDLNINRHQSLFLNISHHHRPVSMSITFLLLLLLLIKVDGNFGQVFNEAVMFY
jgi:hypothetical protein